MIKKIVDMLNKIDKEASVQVFTKLYKQQWDFQTLVVLGILTEDHEETFNQAEEEIMEMILGRNELCIPFIQKVEIHTEDNPVMKGIYYLARITFENGKTIFGIYRVKTTEVRENLIVPKESGRLVSFNFKFSGVYSYEHRSMDGQFVVLTHNINLSIKLEKFDVFKKSEYITQIVEERYKDPYHKKQSREDDSKDK